MKVLVVTVLSVLVGNAFSWVSRCYFLLKMKLTLENHIQGGYSINMAVSDLEYDEDLMMLEVKIKANNGNSVINVRSELVRKKSIKNLKT